MLFWINLWSSTPQNLPSRKPPKKDEYTCWRRKAELIKNVLLWTTHGHTNIGRLEKTYIQFYADIGCCQEDLPRAMTDRDGLRERERERERESQRESRHAIMIMLMTCDHPLCFFSFTFLCFAHAHFAIKLSGLFEANSVIIVNGPNQLNDFNLAIFSALVKLNLSDEKKKKNRPWTGRKDGKIFQRTKLLHTTNESAFSVTVIVEGNGISSETGREGWRTLVS